MNAWQKLGSRVQKVGFKTVVLKDFKLPDGRVEEYVTWNKEKENCIATIAVTKDKKVIVARQFRTGPELIFDEIPGGGADDGEEFETAARRELREETGYETDGPFEYLGAVYKDAYNNDIHHYFLARDCEPTATQELDETEHIQIMLLTIEQFLRNARTGKMSDSAAVLLAYEDLKEIMHA
jgi:ADP-ribose pyrophosphatase